MSGCECKPGGRVSETARNIKPIGRSHQKEGIMALAPELAEELRYLEISVARRIRNLRFGQSRSPLKGSGYEFESHRKYQVGEDFRRIDWNVSARMQEIYLKRHFEEREVSVFLVVDVSRSMHFSTAKHSKNLRVMQVGATL